LQPARPKSALIVGAFGQDGHYLAQYLIAQGYRVVRLGREHSDGYAGTGGIDILDRAKVEDLVGSLAPAEIYYLAALHHSSEQSTPPLDVLLAASMKVNFEGLLNILQAVAARSPGCRVFFASSALVFGEATSAPQTEDTPMRPTTPYGVSKLAAMGACELYRRHHGTFAVSGIMFNHESPRRSPSFVSRKISIAAARAAKGRVSELRLGALDAELDWSAAEDVVRAAHAMLQTDEAIDCVIASGQLHSVRDFASTAFDFVGLNYEDYVREDDTILHRPATSVPRVGDPSRLRAATGFAPQISFDDMVRSMVKADMEAAA
jgi:GDPmannose 4,6-dehydratase